MIDGEELWYCPITYGNSETTQAMSLWLGWRKGFMADDGNFLDQSNRYIDYMEYLDSNQNEYEQQEMERNNRKSRMKR